MNSKLFFFFFCPPSTSVGCLFRNMHPFCTEHSLTPSLESIYEMWVVINICDFTCHKQQIQMMTRPLHLSIFSMCNTETTPNFGCKLDFPWPQWKCWKVPCLQNIIALHASSADGTSSSTHQGYLISAFIFFSNFSDHKITVKMKCVMNSESELSLW